MSDVKGTVLDAIMDAVTGGTGAATSFAPCWSLRASCSVPNVLATHRHVALGLRIAGLLTALTALMLGINSHGWVAADSTRRPHRGWSRTDPWASTSPRP